MCRIITDFNLEKHFKHILRYKTTTNLNKVNKKPKPDNVLTHVFIRRFSKTKSAQLMTDRRFKSKKHMR